MGWGNWKVCLPWNLLYGKILLSLSPVSNRSNYHPPPSFFPPNPLGLCQHQLTHSNCFFIPSKLLQDDTFTRCFSYNSLELNKTTFQLLFLKTNAIPALIVTETELFTSTLQFFVKIYTLNFFCLSYSFLLDTPNVTFVRKQEV